MLWSKRHVFFLFTVASLISFGGRELCFAKTLDFHRYERKTEIPEPLYVDLVRSLDAEPGEWEINSLFTQRGQRWGDMEWAPEIEFVVRPGLAIEFEVPFEGQELKHYKWALQTLLYRGEGSRTLTGLQMIYETDQKFLDPEWTLYWIYAHRWSHHWSSVGLLGGIWAPSQKQENNRAADLNLSLFYNHTAEVDFGIELNYQSPGLGRAHFNVVPQIHLAFNKGFKIQYGFGVSYQGPETSTMTNIRLIRELD